MNWMSAWSPYSSYATSCGRHLPTSSNKRSARSARLSLSRINVIFVQSDFFFLLLAGSQSS